MANNFLVSTAWAKIRADIITLRNGKCERCGNEGKQVHHLCYDRYGGNEEPEDLILLCAYHHQLEHGLIKVKKRRKKKAKKAKNICEYKKAKKIKGMSMAEIKEKSRAMDFKQA